MFSPSLSTWLILLWYPLCLLGLFRSDRRTNRFLSRRNRTMLLVLRIAAITLLALFVLRPTRITRSPDLTAGDILLLTDESLSMEHYPHSAAHPAITRLSKTRDLIAEIRRQSTASLRIFSFADGGASPLTSWSPQKNASSTSAGTSAIGDAIIDAIRYSTDKKPLAAIILLSDGRENGSRIKAVEAAKAAARCRIPISIVPLGDVKTRQAITASFHEHVLTLSDTGASLSIDVINQQPNDASATLSVRAVKETPEEPPRNIATVSLTLSGQQQRREALSLPADTPPGLYALYIDGCDTASDYLQLASAMPAPKRLLYLGSTSNWQWRFLRQALQTIPDLTLSAQLKLPVSSPTEKRSDGVSPDFRPQTGCWRYQLPSAVQDSARFPESLQELSLFDGIIVECSALDGYTREQSLLLRDYVEQIGGGLLLTGDPGIIPATVRTLLPENDYRHQVLPAGHPLQLNQEFIFEGNRDIATISLPSAMDTMVYFPAAVSGDRSAITCGNNGILLHASGYHGQAGGRIAWLGTESLWLLALDSRLGPAVHSQIWHSIVSWLTSDHQRPIAITDAPRVISAGEAAQIQLQILDQNFMPVSTAVCTAAVTVNDGPAVMCPIQPIADDPGQYRLSVRCPRPGKARLSVTAEVNGNTRQLRYDLLIRPNTAEMNPDTVNRPLLEDIARISGGNIIDADDTRLMEKIAISPAVPVIEKKTYPLEETPVPIFILTLLLLIEWRLRRRLGLK